MNLARSEVVKFPHKTICHLSGPTKTKGPNDRRKDRCGQIIPHKQIRTTERCRKEIQGRFAPQTSPPSYMSRKHNTTITASIANVPQNKRSKRPSAEHTSPGYQRGAMCVQQFHDSLNSAIRNTMSHFATVFIDVQAKGSTVGSCFFGGFFRSPTFVLFFPNTFTDRQERNWNEKRLCTVNHRAQPLGAHRRSDTDVKRWNANNRNGNNNDPSAGSPTETLLRLLLPLTDQVGTASRRIPANRCRPPGPQSKVLAKPVNR